jgi:transketolase
MPKSLEELQGIAKRVRGEFVEMIGAAGSGHPGGALPAVEIAVEPCCNTMRLDRKARIHACATEFAGIQNTYAESGEPMQLPEKYGLTAPHIADAARKVLARKL